MRRNDKSYSSHKVMYKKLKQRIKDIVVENAAICDEIANIVAELTLAKEERLFLIKRIMLHEGLESDRSFNQPISVEQKLSNNIKRTHKRKVTEVMPTRNISLKKTLSRTFDIQKTSFPITLNDLVIYSPGEILPVNPNFHTENWIYPVGYIATRIYAHYKSPQRKCVYTCKILNNSGVPQFQIIPENDLDSVFFGDTISVCHQELLKMIQSNISCSENLWEKSQGESFFGLADLNVQSIIQSQVGFSHCLYFRGFPDGNSISDDQNPAVNFEALQTLLHTST